jgi:hypothetical protein
LASKAGIHSGGRSGEPRRQGNRRPLIPSMWRVRLRRRSLPVCEHDSAQVLFFYSTQAAATSAVKRSCVGCVPQAPRRQRSPLVADCAAVHKACHGWCRWCSVCGCHTAGSPCNQTLGVRKGPVPTSIHAHRRPAHWAAGRTAGHSKREWGSRCPILETQRLERARAPCGSIAGRGREHAA